MFSLVRIVFVLLALTGLSPSGAESPISAEWKQRLTESARERIVEQAANPFARAETSSATESQRRPGTVTEESLPILSSLSQLLTQAATETVSLSRDMRPRLDWPGALWIASETEEWSWRERFTWFRDEAIEEATATVDENTSETPAPPPSGVDIDAREGGK